MKFTLIQGSFYLHMRMLKGEKINHCYINGSIATLYPMRFDVYKVIGMEDEEL
jgi:hypothetical protein